MVFLVFWIGAAGLGLVEKVRGVGVEFNGSVREELHDA
jgi:hypothetical protein